MEFYFCEYPKKDHAMTDQEKMGDTDKDMNLILNKDNYENIGGRWRKPLWVAGMRRIQDLLQPLRASDGAEGGSGEGTDTKLPPGEDRGA
jgi:hypothetical protein